MVTTLHITLATNVLEEYWPSPIFTNTLATHEHDYVNYKCDTGSKNSICRMQHRYTDVFHYATVYLFLK